MASNSTRHDEETMETKNSSKMSHKRKTQTDRIDSKKLKTNKNSSKMSHKRKTQTDRINSKKLKTNKNSEDFSLPQDTCEINDPNNSTNDQSDDVEVPLIGDHETQESEGGEADLHKYLVGCKKNPDHSQFIPVDTFTLEHLPEGLQDNDLYEYFKATADLTVRIGVTKSSPHRPEFYPETTQPYPFYNSRGSSILRTGTGRVWDVTKFQNGVYQDGVHGRTAHTKCWCRKCKDSDSASNVWWEFDVYTATQVVFDEIEANHTTLRLFFDRNDCPVVSVDKVSVVDVNIESDVCCLKCVTCDTTLGNKLVEMFRHCENVFEIVWEKYRDSRSEHKFLFIVSHPHGCSKQVSVGQWKDRLEVDDVRCKFTYTTCTCPGSSGAHIQCLGYDWTSHDIVHSGSKSGLNYSGVGYVY